MSALMCRRERGEGHARAVAGLGRTPNRRGTFAYYMSEPVLSNDPKGAGPLILAAEELER